MFKLFWLFESHMLEYNSLDFRLWLQDKYKTIQVVINAFKKMRLQGRSNGAGWGEYVHSGLSGKVT